MTRLHRWLMSLPVRRPSSRRKVRAVARPLGMEALEDRITPDGRPLPFPVIYAGAGEGMPSVVKAYDAETGRQNFETTAFGPGFLGGVRVATADFTRDGFPDVVAAAGPGGGPHIRVLDGKTGTAIDGPLGSFFAYDPAFTGGVNVAAADVDADGMPDVVTAAGPGGGPHVRAFSGKTGTAIADFFAFDPDFRGGISIASVDLTGDGKAEVAVGAGPSGGSHVRVYDPLTGEPATSKLSNFFAFGASNRDGVNLGADAMAGDLDADGTPDLAVGTGAGPSARVRVFSGKSGEVLREIVPFEAFTGGARVGLAYVDDDPFADVVVGSGPGMPATVRVFSGKTGQQLSDPPGEYAPFGSFSGGISIAASNDPYSVFWTVNVTSPVEGQTFTCEVTLTGTSGFVPTGTVKFTANAGFSKYELGVVALVAVGGSSLDSVAILHTRMLPVSSGSILLDYSGDGNFIASNSSTLYGVTGSSIIDHAPGLMQLDPLSGGIGTTAPAPSPRSETGVEYFTGAVHVDRGDLFSAGYGSPFGQGWDWTSAVYFADGLSGNGGMQTQAPHLVQVNGDDSIAIVSSATSVRFADYYAGAYHSRYSDATTVEHDTTNHWFVVTDADGRVFTFHDFSGSTPSGREGRLISLADPGGNLTEVTSWDSGGGPAEVRRVHGSGGTAETESFLSTYISSGVNAGLLDTVTQRHRTGTGSWTTTQSVAFDYYGTGASYGNAGDLRTATVKDSGGTTIDTSYYRYYTSGTGSAGNMAFAFGPAAYDRLVAALGSGVDSLTDGQVDDYADRAFQYNAAGRASSVTVAGAGTFTYSYSTNSSAFLRQANAWLFKTVETRPDGSTLTSYANAFGQIMLTDFEDAATSNNWLQYTQYDEFGRTLLVAGPSAVTGYSESNLDLVGFSYGNATYLSDSDGLFTTFAYAGSTTATTSTAGDVAGRLDEVAIRHGETGTDVSQSNQTYILRTAGGLDFAFPAATTVYRNDDGTGGQTTTLAYTWQGSTALPASITTTRPTVTTGQNGPNSATSSTVVFDLYGRAEWTKDAGGFLGYFENDPRTGAVVKQIADVDSSQTTTFANLPSGWSTPGGGGLHLTATAEVDDRGRATKVTDPLGIVGYTVFKDSAHEVRQYPGWDGTANLPTGPTVVLREDRAGSYVESLSMTATPSVSSGRPTGTESVSGLVALAREHRNNAGQVVYQDAYFNLSGLTYSTSASLGTSGTHFWRSESGYDVSGRVVRVLSASGTIYRTVFDGLNRTVSEWVGTDDTPSSGSWSPTNLTGTDTVKVKEYEFDGGGAGDGNLTQVTEQVGLSAADRVTEAFYDWRNRAVAIKSGVETSESTSLNRPILYREYDNLNQVISSEVYDGDGVSITFTSGVPNRPSSSLLRAKSTNSFDELGRVYRTDVYGVDPSNGSVSSYSLHTDTWFDARGLTIKTASPGGLVQKAAYDGVGRAVTVYTTNGGGDSGYSDADDVSGDTVLSQTETAFDANSNTLMVTSRERFHDASGTGALGSPSSGIGARVSYATAYYDLGNRLTASVDVGTNGGSSYSRPGTVPSRSDTVLVTSDVYDSAGRLWKVTDPRGIENRTEYDALGRTTKTIENYVNGTPSDDDDKTTEYTYGSAGMTKLKAYLTSGYQETEWVYGVSSGSAITSNDIVGATRWPDPSTGASSSGQQDSVTVNALGQTVTSTDRNGSVHTLGYDVLGRLVSDSVTTLGSGVDGSVRRIEISYNALGLPELVTSYDAATSGNVVNQVRRDYNGLGQLVTEYQEHSGAVNTGTSPKVQYAYSEMSGGANHSRLTSMTYPNGKVLTYNYSSGLNSDISRLSSLSDTSGTLESYDYLGLTTVVKRAHSQPGLDLTYIKQSGESDGDAGDKYTGLDRFGRVTDQRWIVSGTAVSRTQYGYDRDSNRTYRDDLVNSAFGELYAYDNLNQLTSFDRGTLNGTKTGITGTATRTQDWDYDALGNMDGVNTDGTNVTRTHNKQNEITAFGAASPVYDANGNLTTDETGKQFVYDAWNRLVTVKNFGGTTIKTIAYDGLYRRISTTVSSVTTDLYYSAAWQVLEKSISGNATAQYVWSPVYVDALILRDRDTDANGSLDERLWAIQDANFNVVALADGSGVIVERFVYDPFGVVTVLTGAYGSRASSSYAWSILFQGMHFDDTSGQYVQRFRRLSPTQMRWTTMDPIGYSGVHSHLYCFVGNMPADSLDILGLQAKKSNDITKHRLIAFREDDTGQIRLWKQMLLGYLKNPGAGGLESPLSAFLMTLSRRESQLSDSEVQYLNTLISELPNLVADQGARDAIQKAINSVLARVGSPHDGHVQAWLFTSSIIQFLLVTYPNSNLTSTHLYMHVFDMFISRLGHAVYDTRETAARDIKMLFKSLTPDARVIMLMQLQNARYHNPDGEIRQRAETLHKELLIP